MGDIAEFYDHCYDEDDEQPSVVECKHCGKGGLSWEDDNGQWVLLDKHGKVHRCPTKQATDNDFKPLV